MEVHLQTGNYVHLNLFIRAATATMSDDFLKIGYNARGFAFGRVGGRSSVKPRRTLVRVTKLHVGTSTPPDAKPMLGVRTFL